MKSRKRNSADLAGKHPKPAVEPARDSTLVSPRSPSHGQDGEPDFFNEPDLPEGEPSGAPTQNTKERLPGER